MDGKTGRRELEVNGAVYQMFYYDLAEGNGAIVDGRPHLLDGDGQRILQKRYLYIALYNGE